MRHAKKRQLLNRPTSQYRAFLLITARNLLKEQSIKTTLQKAKAVRPLVERLISLAKKNTLAAKRRAFEFLGDHKLVSELFKDIGPRFLKRQGGYTRIILLNKRRGDDAQLAILELTEMKAKEVKKPKKAKEEKPALEGEKTQVAEDLPAQEKKIEAATAVKEKSPVKQKPNPNQSLLRWPRYSPWLPEKPQARCRPPV